MRTDCRLTVSRGGSAPFLQTPLRTPSSQGKTTLPSKGRPSSLQRQTLLPPKADHPVNRQTPVKTLPSPILRMRSVINFKLELVKDESKCRNARHTNSYRCKNICVSTNNRGNYNKVTCTKYSTSMSVHVYWISDLRGAQDHREVGIFHLGWIYTRCLRHSFGSMHFNGRILI